MYVLTLENKNYLAKTVENDTAFNAYAINKPNVLGMKDFIGYVKAENLGELQDIKFGNAIFTSRGLTAIERGSYTMVLTAMEEARKTAIATVENSRLEQLLGE